MPDTRSYLEAILIVSNEIERRATDRRQRRQDERALELWEQRKTMILSGEEIPRQTSAPNGR